MGFRFWFRHLGVLICILCGLSQAYSINDQCASADPISCGQTIVANTNAVVTPTIFSTPILANWKALWYEFTGTGQNIVLSQEDLDTASLQIALFYQSCGSLRYVGSDLSEIRVRTEAGRAYKLAVYHQLTDSTGSFSVHLRCLASAPANDQCQNAILISVGDTVSGSLAYSVKDPPDWSYCPLKNNWDVYYQIEGNGEVIRFDIQPIDQILNPSIEIYYNRCDTVQCLYNLFDNTTRSFSSEAGELYNIRMTGAAPVDSGDFVLYVTSVASNDGCATAIPLGASSQLSYVPPDPNLGFSSCTDPQTTGGQWYSIEGHGGLIQILTLANTNQLQVYTGICDQLECVPTTELHWNLPVDHDIINFFAVQGQTYYINYRGNETEGGFSIYRSTLAPNDKCTGAQVLNIGDTVSVTNQFALRDSIICNSFDYTTHGVWYQVQGNGDYIIVEHARYKAYNISFFEESCDPLMCIPRTRDLGRTYIASKAGVTYYILFEHFGRFEDEISISTRPITSNDFCEDAIQIMCGESYRGDFEYAYPNKDCSFYSLHGGVWHSFLGTGDIFSIDFSADDNFGLEFFEGSCDSLVCNFANQSPNPERFLSEPGKWYYLSFQRLYRGGGTGYDVSLACETPEPNNMCQDALQIACGDTVSLNFTNTTVSELGCSSTERNDLWYRTVGTGDLFQFITEESEEAYLEVFADSCNSSNCIYPLNGKYTFEDGRNYYIRVMPAIGSLPSKLSLLCIPTIPNDICASAIAVNCGTQISGTTKNAKTSIVPGTCVSSSRPAAWYKLVGDDQLHSIHLDSSESNYLRVAVLSGDCHELQCKFSKRISQGVDSLEFLAEQGEEYFIVVQPNTSVGEDFHFTIKCKNRIVDNDGCFHASDIVCGRDIIGSFEGASNDPAYAGCQDVNQKGIWYRIIGDGKYHYVNNIGSRVNLSLLSGNCTSLTCLKKDDISNSMSSEFSFFAPENEILYLLVSQYSDEMNFALMIDCVDLAPNDECVNAISLTTDSCVFMDYSIVSTPSFNNTSNRDVWFHFTGQKNIRIEIDFDIGSSTSLELYSGSCNGLTFITGKNQDFSDQAIQLDTLNPSLDYYVRVYTSTNPQLRNFQLCFAGFEAVSNNTMEQSELINVDQECNPGKISTINSTPSIGHNSNDVWYKFKVPDHGNLNIRLSPVAPSTILSDHRRLILYAKAENNLVEVCLTRAIRSEFHEFRRSDFEKYDTLFLRIVNNFNRDDNYEFYLCVNEFEPFANDEPSTATELSTGEICDFEEIELLNYSGRMDCFNYDYWRYINTTDINNLMISIRQRYIICNSSIQIFTEQGDTLKEIPYINKSLSSWDRRLIVRDISYDKLFLRMSCDRNFQGLRSVEICAIAFEHPPNTSKDSALQLLPSNDCTNQLFNNDFPVGEELWFYFIAPVETNVIILQEMVVDEDQHLIEVYRSSSNGLEELDYNQQLYDQSHQTYGNIQLADLIPGDSIFLKVTKTTRSARSQFYKLCIEPFVNPPGDYCHTSLTVPYTLDRFFTQYHYSYATKEQGYEPISECVRSSSFWVDMWYQFTPPLDGDYIIETERVRDFEIYRGSCNNLEFVTCQRTNTDLYGSRTFLSGLQAGERYFYRAIDQYWCKNDSISIAFYSLSIHPNDEINGAFKLAYNEICDYKTFTTEFSTPSDIVRHCTRYTPEGRDDIWFELDRVLNGNLFVKTNPEFADPFAITPIYELYGLEEGQLIFITCFADIGVFESLDRFEKLFIRVYPASTRGQGIFSFCVSSNGPPDNDTIPSFATLLPSESCMPDTFNTQYATLTDFPFSPCANLNPGHKRDSWYQTTAPNGELSLSIGYGSRHKLVIEVYARSLAGWLLIRCNVINRSTNGPTTLHYDRLQATEVYVRVIEIHDVSAGLLNICAFNNCSDFDVPERPSIYGPQMVCSGIEKLEYEMDATGEYETVYWTLNDSTFQKSGPDAHRISLSPAELTFPFDLYAQVENGCGLSKKNSIRIYEAGEALCLLASCLRKVTYVDDQLLDIPGSLDVYYAQTKIESDATIDDLRDIIFKAGQNVDLYPNFSVSDGSSFIADIGGCANVLMNGKN